MSSNARQWDIALVGASDAHAFVLFVVGSGLCRTQSDFESHFVDGSGAFRLAEELTKIGLICITIQGMTLTEQGAALVRSIHLPVSNVSEIQDTVRPPITQVPASSDRIGSVKSEPLRKWGNSKGDGSLVGVGVGHPRQPAALGGVPDGTEGCRLVLYNGAIHPEHIDLQGRRSFRGREFELEAWIMNGGHALRFEGNRYCFTELLVPVDAASFPEKNMVASRLCSSECDLEHHFDKVRYLVSVQTETLTATSYTETYDEVLRTLQSSSALIHVRQTEHGCSLSSVEFEQWNRNELCIQSFHMIAQHRLVVRTQSLIEVRR